MKLTIEQALKKGISKHKEGKLQDAELLYKAILAAQPRNPEANYYLGIIAASSRKADLALPLFKHALDANPKIEQYWLTYIDALIKCNQSNKARVFLKRAKTFGVTEARLEALETELRKINGERGVDRSNPSKEQLSKLLDYYQAGRLDQAEKLATLISEQYPDHPFSWKVLGAVLKNSGRIAESLSAMRKSVHLAPEDSAAFNNLGVTLKDLGELGESEVNLLKAIELEPKNADAYNNLGNTLKEFGRLEDSLIRYRKAIELKPDFAEAYNNLGHTLFKLDRYQEAETNCRQAVELKPEYAEAHCNLCRVLYQRGSSELALQSAKNASDIDPNSKKYRLILIHLATRRFHLNDKRAEDNQVDVDYHADLMANPLILHRAVEPTLISKLYEIESTLDKKATLDARFKTFSSDFNLFDNPSGTMERLSSSLTNILEEAFGSKIYIYDSFVNILKAGGGTTPHCHLNEFDRDNVLDLGKKKYSLQYYLSVGDQECSEPGILKLYDPPEEILPIEGMITVIPACRFHSAAYSGAKDRVMVGANFYKI